MKYNNIVLCTIMLFNTKQEVVINSFLNWLFQVLTVILPVCPSGCLFTVASVCLLAHRYDHLLNYSIVENWLCHSSWKASQKPEIWDSPYLLNWCLMMYIQVPELSLASSKSLRMTVEATVCNRQKYQILYEGCHPCSVASLLWQIFFLW